MTQDIQTHTDETSDLVRRRHEELEELKRMGINPYPYSFPVDAQSDDILARFQEEAPRRDVAVAGRIMTVRRMGKASFLHIQDGAGRIQIYLRKDDLPNYDMLRLLDIGDIIGVRGYVFRTKTGEVSVHAVSLELLSKSLRPLPVAKEKIDDAGNRVVYDQFADKELRYRKRALDLIVNPEVREVFVKRTRIVRAIRAFLDGRGYLEVETPALQPLYGGASARPFVTHHNALDIDLFLRIADELYLKRLIVGGLNGVYEIAKNFRNEGMDRSHNPEFTMLELYVPYQDYVWMMELAEQMLSTVCVAVNGSTRAAVRGAELDFSPPFRRLTMLDAIRQYTDQELRGLGEEALRAAAKLLYVEPDLSFGPGKIIDEIFSERVQPHLVQPTFITDYPLEMSPLAKKHRAEEGLVERFELFVNGQEIANAFSELNDPIDQRARFEEQARLRARGDAEAMTYDEDFVEALEYGMPPTAGMGVGVDRLVMLFSGAESIRDVILFPTMRPEK